VTVPNVGRCLLCLRTGELRESHFVPKALYRMVRAGSRGAHPLQITADGKRQTSRQAVQRILCHDCEQRFSTNGENWVLKHCYRGRDVFRLRRLLEQSKPVHADSEALVYSAPSVSGLGVESLVYFCISVMWRASVTDWWVSGRKYESISLGSRYQEQLRRYLLGETELPETAAVVVIVSGLNRPVLAFNFPVSYRLEFCHSHRFHIPGMTFLLGVGGRVSKDFGEICVRRSQLRPIFVSKDGDARVQREIMRLMGKVAPPWAEYPVTEGVEDP
jgi:hypothetical protein